ncbi:MAG TPA: 4-hydroxyphenylpyruvate dioxygenase [Acidobacteriota bacterium]|nr:4-hydroxyphenylpyruvate dioxygenase [Acidobacteriota bacterium]
MEENPLGLRGIHHIEFCVGNAKQACYYYRNALGFSQRAYAGLETGERTRTSYVLQQGEATFVLTTPLRPDDMMSEHIRRHGDGVRDIAFEVSDADLAFARAVARGAQPAVEPRTLEDRWGKVRHAAICTYGDTIHSFISTNGYDGPFLPGFDAAQQSGKGAGLLRIDHLVGNVELGKMNCWAEWYSRVCGFRRYMSFDDKDISTEYSALMSIVMSNDSTAIKMPINEPAPGLRKSQIEEYLEFYQGAGVQHIALMTANIIDTVETLGANGIEFLEVPPSYYEALRKRVGDIDEDVQRIRNLGILVDRDDEGYLLQIFTKPAEDRPTLFFEIIQRKGSRGFGKGNFKALFEAIEREQGRRGNL